MFRFVQIAFILSFCFTMSTAAKEPAKAIRKSDVVFMYDNPERYLDYGCTVLGWAGYANADRIALAHERGVRHFTSSVGFLTEASRVIEFGGLKDRAFLDAAARNFAGEPFIVPWLWDHEYKGERSYWWCTNSPLYRRYLESRLKEVVATGPDGLHVDDYRGSSGSVTWLSGCFCKYCMAAFREYLSENVPEARLQELGIESLEGFDYRRFLIDRGVKPEEYNNRRRSLPLAAEFLDFHVQAATEYIGAYHAEAERLRGGPMSLCVNSGLGAPETLAIAPYLSYFCCELRQDAASLQTPRHPIYVYKLADGLERPVASTASGQDWAYVYEHGNVGLVRTWIALSYAMGHNFMAPQRQWCYTKEKGTHWYDGPTKEYAYVYRFVRDHAALLDGYEAVAPVAVLYDNQARREGKGNIEKICVELAERNIPFTVCVAGDSQLRYRLPAGVAEDYRALVVTGDPLAMDAEQAALVQAAEKKGRVVRWNDPKRDTEITRLVGRPVSVQGASGVMVVPRKSDDPKKALVVHLLNRAYEGDTDSSPERKDFRVVLERESLGLARAFTQATLHQPGLPSRELTVRSDKATITIAVSSLTLWGLVEIR